LLQVAVEKFLTRATELETRDGLSEADMLNVALLKDNLLTFMNGIGNSDHGPKGFVYVIYFCCCNCVCDECLQLSY